MQLANRWILLGLFFLSTSLLNAQPQTIAIDSLLQLVTTDSYRSHFDSIRTGPENFRKVMPWKQQSTDHDACRDYIYRSFQKYLGNENCYLHCFSSGNHQGLANVIGVKPGNRPDKGIWIVGAHYDSNNNNEPNYQARNIAPGANDNGTGVAALLELAKTVGSLETEATIIFAAWDFEEVFTNGFGTGSKTWAEQFIRKRKPTDWENLARMGMTNLNDVRGNINFDMFGNPQTDENGQPILWACFAKDNQQDFTQAYAETVNRYNTDLIAISFGKLIWSDHSTFAALKIPSVENLESNYQLDPFYHTYSDNIKNKANIDFDFATNVTRGGLAFLLEQVLRQSNAGQPIDQGFLCRSETVDYYCIEGSNEITNLQVFSQFGMLVAQATIGKTIFFNPPVSGWYYIKAMNKSNVQSQIVYLKKKKDPAVPFF